METAVILVSARKPRAKHLEVPAALYFNIISVNFGFMYAPEYKSASKFRWVCSLIEFSQTLWRHTLSILDILHKNYYNESIHISYTGFCVCACVNRLQYFA